MSRDVGGVGDGLPSLPSGEPVLARWFVLAMIPLVLLGIGVTIWMFASFSRDPLTAAERWPPGSATVTHERGRAALNDITDTEPGPSCAEGITLIGDEGARATVRRALGATCQILTSGAFPEAEDGLRAWIASDGVARVAVFEVTGLESSARLEDGRIVVELNPRFQVEDATRAAPFVIHELVHMAQGWPGQAVDVDGELAAQRAAAEACDRLTFRKDPPLGCVDAQELTTASDAAQQLRDAGYGGGS